MGDILIEQRSRIMAILSNYLIGEELDFTVAMLVKLGISDHDLPELKIIFNDVGLTQTRLRIFDIGKYDIFSYTFTPEEISHEVSITKKIVMKLLYSPYYLLCIGIYKNEWIKLRDALKSAFQKSHHL